MIQQEDVLHGRIDSSPIIIRYEPYTGSYEITPKVTQQQMLTQNKVMTDNVTIKKISTYEVSNPQGITFIIGDM